MHCWLQQITPHVQHRGRQTSSYNSTPSTSSNNVAEKKRKSLFRTLFHRLTRTHSQHEPTPTSATTIAAAHAPVNKVNYSHSESEVTLRETRVSSELQSTHSASVIEQRSRGYKNTPEAPRSSNIDRRSGDQWEQAYELAKKELTDQEWKSICD